MKIFINQDQITLGAETAAEEYQLKDIQQQLLRNQFDNQMRNTTLSFYIKSKESHK